MPLLHSNSFILRVIKNGPISYRSPIRDFTTDIGKNVLFRTQTHVAYITINRPRQRNAVDKDTASMLYECLQRFEQDSELHVAILSGAGGHFSAGADLKSISDEKRRNPLLPVEGTDSMGPMGPTRLTLSKPVIAAVSGACVAGGLELALWCHMRVVEEGARLGVLCRRFGVPLIDGGTVRLPRLIGESRAMDLILTGREIDGKTSYEYGIASRLVKNGTALDEATKIAEQLSGFPQACLRTDMQSALRQWNLREKEALRMEFNNGLVALKEDGFEGAQRFAQGEGRHGSFEFKKK